MDVPLDYKFDYEKELNSIKDKCLAQIGRQACVCMFITSPSGKLSSHIQHELTQDAISSFIKDMYSYHISKAKWIRYKIKTNVYDSEYLKIWSQYDEEVKSYHEKNKHLNIELGEWDASV